MLLVCLVVQTWSCVNPSESTQQAPNRDHILLLTVDTLRSDHLSANGHPLPTTPSLDQLVRGGVFFPNAVAPVPRTTPSLASVLTGAYPHGHGVRTLYDRLDISVTSLAEVLADRGYRTVAVVSNHVLVPERGLGRGFEVYDFADDARHAEATTEAALRHMANLDRDEKIFLWVHYIDPHVPYFPPQQWIDAFSPGYRGRYAEGFGTLAGGRGDRAYPPDLPKAEAVYRNPLTPEVNAHVRRLYAGDIRAMDEAIGELMEGLRTQIRNDWTVLFTSDHGESLGEHDFFYDHGDYVYQASLRVPLAFVLPPGDPLARSAVVEQPVSLVDILPTVLDLLGFELPQVEAAQVEGKSLRPWFDGKAARPQAVFAESGHSFYPHLVRRRVDHSVAGRFRAVILGDWKLIWTPGQESEHRYELYDLRQDPAEEVNLYRPEHPEVAVLQRALESWFRPDDLAVGGEDIQTLSPDDLERLRSLGYLP